jgi:pyruvate,water dikinase
MILRSSDQLTQFSKYGGGKAHNLARMLQMGVPVPSFFCVSTRAFEAYLDHHGLRAKLKPSADLKAFEREVEVLFLAHPLPESMRADVLREWNALGGEGARFAVRSSGADEDSAMHSFAGLFSSFLDQRGAQAIEDSLRRCWASGFTERALRYRIERGIQIERIGIAVVIQRMVRADSAGVAFSRDPLQPLERDALLIESVWGLGEGLVSGEIDADRFELKRSDLSVKSTAAEKTHAIIPAPQGGVQKLTHDAERSKAISLTDDQSREIARLALDLERKTGILLDLEWAFESGKLYCVQMRPITSLPAAAFYSESQNGLVANLWDNSNIIESFSGVTSPLTFSFASHAYQTVYYQISEMLGVPKSAIIENESRFKNMLGLLRGRIYYNLANWYRLLMMLPGSANNASFMETMMGVKKDMRKEDRAIFDFMNTVAPWGTLQKIKVALTMGLRFVRSQAIIRDFKFHFNRLYQIHRKLNYSKIPLQELSNHYSTLVREILYRWQAPIVNDFLCMIFFGSLKKLVQKWIAEGDAGSSLQNDLLCGQGHLESTEPTKCLMRIAAAIDQGGGRARELFVQKSPTELITLLQSEPELKEVRAQVEDFLDRFGFRCVNELKLEEKDLNEDPAFVMQAISSYVRMKAYSIEEMLERELKIRAEAEARVREKVKGFKRLYFFWILKHARRAVQNREDLRFDRTKIYGICRRLFRAMGEHLHALGALEHPRDVFYITVEELQGWIDGRAVTLNLSKIAEIRKREFDEFRKTPSPPERFVTYGAVGASLSFPGMLDAGDLLRKEMPVSTDPNVLLGTPCSPGVVEGVVLVAHEIADTVTLNGQILVTSRTDPGWVPLYPSCTGLLIERGSLLSHSAVVARELGLPTIVGISGGLMTRLKSGMRVRMDAARGEVRILE